MLKFQVDGYKLSKDHETWDYKRVKIMTGLDVEIHATDVGDEAENIELTLCRKYNLEGFEVINYVSIN